MADGDQGQGPEWQAERGFFGRSDIRHGQRLLRDLTAGTVRWPDIVRSSKSAKLGITPYEDGQWRPEGVHPQIRPFVPRATLPQAALPVPPPWRPQEVPLPPPAADSPRREPWSRGYPSGGGSSSWGGNWSYQTGGASSSSTGYQTGGASSPSAAPKAAGQQAGVGRSYKRAAESPVEGTAAKAKSEASSGLTLVSRGAAQRQAAGPPVARPLPVVLRPGVGREPESRGLPYAPLWPPVVTFQQVSGAPGQDTRARAATQCRHALALDCHGVLDQWPTAEEVERLALPGGTASCDLSWVRPGFNDAAPRGRPWYGIPESTVRLLRSIIYSPESPVLCFICSYAGDPANARDAATHEKSEGTRRLVRRTAEGYGQFLGLGGYVDSSQADLPSYGGALFTHIVSARQGSRANGDRFDGKAQYLHSINVSLLVDDCYKTAEECAEYGILCYLVQRRSHRVRNPRSFNLSWAESGRRTDERELHSSHWEHSHLTHFEALAHVYRDVVSGLFETKLARLCRSQGLYCPGNHLPRHL